MWRRGASAASAATGKTTMPGQNDDDTDARGGRDLVFVAASACIFLVIAVCVVYFVIKIIL